MRRERAVVTVKDIRGATFVRFNAPDARLLTLACEAVLGSTGQSTLRFGFASGVKEPAEPGQDGLSISHRSIAQASDLAAGARDGEVLVSPQLAALLVESGLTFQSKDVHLQGGRIVAACSLDLTAGLAQKPKPDDRPQHLLAPGLQQSIDALEARVDSLQHTAADAERRLAEVLARHGEIDELRKRCDTLATQLAGAQQQLGEMAAMHERLLPLTAQVAALLQSLQTLESRHLTAEEVQARAHTLTHMLGDVNLKLEMLSEQRAAVDHVGEQLARLDYTVQEAQNTLRALQREREVAERVEQGIKALRSREGAPKLS